MLHARLFAENPKYRSSALESPRPSSATTCGSHQGHEPVLSPSKSLPSPCLDGNPIHDRPLIVQFCANSPEHLLTAAKQVAPHCDAVDLNLGCPQGIARKGHYGAFLQEDWSLIHSLINKLHRELPIPVTAKFRILETPEKTLQYAKMILDAGASIITIHGRQREQKGHNTGLADYTVLRYLREELPQDTVIFANGNVLLHEDLEACLRETGADGVMSAEGNLHDPSIFAELPQGGEDYERAYWRGRDDKQGYRVDAVFRKYMDIIYKHVLEQEPPQREPLFLPGDSIPNGAFQLNAEDPQPPTSQKQQVDQAEVQNSPDGPPLQKRSKLSQKSRAQKKATSPSLQAMQAHLFNVLRPLVTKHHNVRDALARCRAEDFASYEHVLRLTEEAVARGLIAYEERIYDGLLPDKLSKPLNGIATELNENKSAEEKAAEVGIEKSSWETVHRCKKPWWVCQPYVRPLPSEAINKGALTLSKKQKKKLEGNKSLIKDAGLPPEGTTVHEQLPTEPGSKVEVPKEGMVCG